MGNLRLLSDEEEVCPGIRTFWAGVHHRSSIAICIETKKGNALITDSFFKYGNLEGGYYLGVMESMMEADATWKRIKQESSLIVKPAEVKANAYLAENIVNPAVDSIKGETGTTRQTATLTLALGLEDAAAQTYAKAGGILTTPTLRQAITSIGAIENKHYSVLASVLNLQVVPFSFAHINLAAPPDSYVEPNGPVPSTTSTTARATAGTTPGTTR